jgi:hypothetical protein
MDFWSRKHGIKMPIILAIIFVDANIFLGYNEYIIMEPFNTNDTEVGGVVIMEKEYRSEDICYLIVKVLEFCKETWDVSFEEFISLIEKHNIPEILWEGYDSFKLDTVEVIAEELSLLVRSS